MKSLFRLLLHSVRSDKLVRRAREELLKAGETRERQEARIASLQRAGAVSQLSSLIAHEIHQPLAAIRLYADGLAWKGSHGTATMDTVASVSQKIAVQAERARLIVDRVRDYARRREPERRPVDMRAVLEHLSRTQTRVFSAVVISPGDGQALVMGSGLELELAVLNVVRNAVEAAMKRPGPRVTAAVRSDQETVSVVVSDNGPAISDRTLESLSSLVTSEKPEGLGMGLSIVKNIVESREGRISFRRRAGAPDTGVTVTITLPRPTPAEGGNMEKEEGGG